MKDWVIFINEYDKNSILVVGYKPNLLETQKAIVKDGYTIEAICFCDKTAFIQAYKYEESNNEQNDL